MHGNIRHELALATAKSVYSLIHPLIASLLPEIEDLLPFGIVTLKSFLMCNIVQVVSLIFSILYLKGVPSFTTLSPIARPIAKLLGKG